MRPCFGAYRPLVMKVCRRVLGNHHDAEDVFQTTFLVLARKASSIRSREMLANWLHGVAFNTALNARKMKARRWGRERQVSELPEWQAAPHASGHDFQPLLDQELSRLPEIYRLPILLCHLEGKSIKRTAQYLGWPEGTVAGRLARGRQMLAKRLALHGLAMASAGLVLQNSASTSVAPTLVASTVKAASAIISGKSAATGLISANVAVLMKGVLSTMFMTKIKIATAVVMVGLIAVGCGMLLNSTAGGQQIVGGDGVQRPAIRQVAQVGEAARNEGTVELMQQDEQAKTQPKDPPKNFINSIGMKFVWIPPGSFMMGSPKKEVARVKGEIQHKVTFTKGFYMGVYTVTQEQWQAVMGNNPSWFKGEKNPKGEKNLPVEMVSWEDCQAFLKKMRKKKGCLSLANRSGMGICLSCRNDDTILLWRNYIHRCRPITMAATPVTKVGSLLDSVQIGRRLLQ